MFSFSDPPILDTDDTNRIADSISSFSAYRDPTPTTHTDHDLYSVVSSSRWSDIDMDLCSIVVSDPDAAFAPPQHTLSSLYSRNMFEPFSSNLFPETSEHSPPAMSVLDDLAHPENGSTPQNGTPGGRVSSNFLVGDTFPFTAQSLDFDVASLPFLSPGEDELLFGALMNPSLYTTPSPSMSHTPHMLGPENGASPASNAVSSMDLTEAEKQRYLYLFFSAFLPQMPIVHAATFKSAGKPAVLLSAMQACGAPFLKTRKAATFISKVLESAREILVQEFAKNPTDSIEQVHLILAVVLLQTIGLFHQKSDERASSSIYHVMLVMMIRRTGLIVGNKGWMPQSFDTAHMETVWQDWALHEMTKRAILLTYLYDTCHCIYFVLPPSFHPTEVELKLPCEEALWTAGSASEWYLTLQAPSLYGSAHERLTGVSMPQVLSQMWELRTLTNPTLCNPFSHFILIHAILRRLFSVFVDSRSPSSLEAQHQSQPQDRESEGSVSHDVYNLQYALHNWLQSWLQSPELPTISENEEPPFTAHALPFYWLGQVSILAYQEGLPPFEYNSGNNLKGELRFRLVKKWLKHIRGFLRKGDGAPTRIWDELMKIRLETQQVAEVEAGAGDDQEGLLGFFAEL